MTTVVEDVSKALRVGMITAILGLSAISLVGTGMVLGITQAKELNQEMGRFGSVTEAPVIVNRIAPGYTIVNILTDIRAPSDYMEVYYILMDANLGDVVQFNISSTGGRVDSMVALAGMMHSSPANVIANVVGPAYSAAAMITLAADEVRMSEGSWLMYHDIQLGSISGERGRIVEALTTYRSGVEEFFKAYNTKGILTQEEINGLFEGNEVYLTKEDVDARIKAGKEKEERTVPQGDTSGSGSVGSSGLSLGYTGSDHILSPVRYAH